MKKLIFILLLFTANVSYSWDGIASGKINYFDVVTNGDNLGYRVYLEGLPTLCGNERTWAYITLSDSNYSAMVSTLMAAKFADRNVRLYSNVDDRTYCHIGYMRVY